MSLTGKKCGLKYEKKIAIWMLIFGLVMAFLIPTWQTPDEYTHLSQIGSSINNESFAGILNEKADVDTGRIIRNYDEKVDVNKLLDAMTAGATYNKEDLMPKGISLSILKYLPSTIGGLVGAFCGVSAYWVLQFAEIFSLLFYVSVCYFALKLMPIKKELFALVMLMPMALQQAGGIGYDASLLSLCFFFIAYVFHLKFKDRIGWKDFIGLMAIWLIITYIKMPYCFLILLLFILPIDKIHLRIGKFEINGRIIRKIRIPICILGIVILAVGVYCLRNHYYINIVIGLFQEWRRTLYLLKETVRNWSGMLIVSSVGNFGWLDTPIHYGVAVLVYVVIALSAMFNDDKKEDKKLTKWDVLVVWGTFFVLCLFTVFAMVNHTIMVNLFGSEWSDGTYNIRTALYQIPYIGGLQGRYFLPFVGLFFLPLPQLKHVSSKKMRIAFSAFELIVFGYIMYILLCRYWI